MTLYLNEGFINETEKKGNKCVPFLIYYISIGEFSMPEPAYPHPIPNPNLVVKNNPQPSDITGLPLLTKFIADVDRWFTDIRVTPACRPLAIDEPGRVLILAKGEEHRVVDVGGAEITVDNSAMVLNGDIPSVGFLHNRWVKRIKTLAQTGNVPPQATLDNQGKTYWAAPKAFDTSRTPAAGGSCNGNYDCTNGTIYINAT